MNMETWPESKQEWPPKPKKNRHVTVWVFIGITAVLGIVSAATHNGYPMEAPVIFLVILLYWLPTVIARNRKVPNIAQIAIVNGFFGWTMLGWVVALVWAMAPKSRH